jgi:hypothetical protein
VLAIESERVRRSRADGAAGAVQCRNSSGTALRDPDSGSWQLDSSDSDRPSEVVDTTRQDLVGSSTRSSWGLSEPLFDADGPASVRDLDLATAELGLGTWPRMGV